LLLLDKGCYFGSIEKCVLNTEVMMSDRIARWAWYALLVLACALHLVFLYQTPLSPGELPQALASLDAVRGAEFSTTADSTLLFLGNTLLFSVFGAGNGIARLIPALAGIGIALLPFYWRRNLGSAGALTAAGLLLISPLMLFISRRVEGTTLSTLAVAILFTVMTSMQHKGEHRNLHNLSVILAVSIGLLSGPAFYDLLLAGLAAWLFKHWYHRERIDWNACRTWIRPALTGTGLAFLISIGFGFRLSGWNGLMVGLAQWLSSWSAASEVSHLGALMLYEPLSLILAVLGFGFAWKRRDARPLALALWALLDLLVTSIRGGAPVSSTGTVVLPLAYLAGYGIKNMVFDMDMVKDLSRWIVLHIVLGFIFLLPTLLGLTQYGSGLISASQPLLVLSGAIVLLALQALLAFLFSLVLPVKVLWRSVFLGVSLMLLYIQAGFGLQLNYVRPTSALEPAVMSAGSPDTEMFKQMVYDIGMQRGLREDTLEISLVDEVPEITNSVRWLLRDFIRLKVVPTWPPDAEQEHTNMLVITPEGMDLSSVTAPGWKGMRFTAIHSYLAPAPACLRTVTEESTYIDCSDFVNWYLYRTSPYPQSPQGAILWVNRSEF
jgi:hypothetical protein